MKPTQCAKACDKTKPRLGEVRLRPDGSVICYTQEDGDDHKPVKHFRTLDVLTLLFKNGSITGAMYDAGRHFAQDFTRAFASGVAGIRLDGLPAGTVPAEHLELGCRCRSAIGPCAMAGTASEK